MSGFAADEDLNLPEPVMWAIKADIGLVGDKLDFAGQCSHKEANQQWLCFW